MDIEIGIKAVLNSFEMSELERVLETVESYVLHSSGLHSINGGYVNANAYDVQQGEVILEIEEGEQNMGDGCSKCNKSRASISREVLDDKQLSKKDKLEKVVWS